MSNFFLKILRLKEKNLNFHQANVSKRRNLHAEHEINEAKDNVRKLCPSSSIFGYNDKSINNVQNDKEKFFFLFSCLRREWKCGTHNFSPSTWQHNNSVTENLVVFLFKKLFRMTFFSFFPVLTFSSFNVSSVLLLLLFWHLNTEPLPLKR